MLKLRKYLTMEEALLSMNAFDAALAAQQVNYAAACATFQFAKATLILRRWKKQKRTVSVYIKPRSLHYFRKTWPLLDEGRFKEMFRFDRDGFMMIVDAVESRMLTKPPPGLKTIVNRQLPVYQQVAMALNKLVTGNSSIGVATTFGVASLTIRRCTWKFVKAVVSQLKSEFLKWPSPVEMNRVKSEFKAVYGLPNCVGAIDCTHIDMECPDAKLASDFRDRKCSFSIQVQAVVDSNMRFLDVVAGWAGSVHDSRIFSLSNLFLRRSEFFSSQSMMINGVFVQEYLIGDAGYPLTVNMMIPFPGRESSFTREQRVYNFKHSSTRMAVERAFGRLKTVFRILKNIVDRPNMEQLPTIVLACCILHNIHLSLYADDVIVEEDRDLRRPMRRNIPRPSGSTYRIAENVTETLKHYLCSLPNLDRSRY